MNEIFCGRCFAKAAQFICQCKCTYCRECKGNDICQCTGSKVFLELTQNVPDSVKLIPMPEMQILKKAIENILNESLNTLSFGFNSLYMNAEVKQQQNKAVQKNLTEKLKKIMQENEELKKKPKETFSFSMENEAFLMGSLKNNGVGLSTPLSASKKNFDFAPFDDFFNKP